MIDLSKPFALKRPCHNCPFLKLGAIELHPGRLDEIIADITGDDMASFHCHKTLDNETKSYCAGAMIYLYKAGHPNVAMRLGQAFGMFDPESLAPSFVDVIDPPSIRCPHKE
jgi:hypothetical protein